MLLFAIGVLFPCHSQAATNSSRVLLISIDGMHAVDLARYVRFNTNSALASLMANAVNYPNASCAKPADSFPGMLAIDTGGSPISTGVYFDLSYDRSLWPPNVTNGPTGTGVTNNELICFNPLALDGGGGLNPALLPRDPARGGAVVYPHNFLRVNTIFEIIKAAGYRTAWSDKHLADEMNQGPSGQGIDDLYLLEINANNAFGVGVTKSFDFTKVFDGMKVQGILNQINGLDHTGVTNVGVPTIFGMNFQAVSVVQRLKINLNQDGTVATGTNAGPGGYLDATGTPSTLLSNALSFVDASLGSMITALQSNGLFNSTYIIITAKHGNSPIDPRQLNVTYKDSTMAGLIDPSVTHIVMRSGDDSLLFWLQNQSTTAAAVSVLNNTTNAFIQDVLSGDLLKLRYPDPLVDPRTPDIIVIGKPGTIYSGTKKIAEHGGFNDQDQNVPLVISRPGLSAQTVKSPVTTAQLAPTILQLLNLNPFALQAVQIEKTTVLPGFDAAQIALNPIAPSLGYNGVSIVHLTNGQAQFQVAAAQRQNFAVQASTDLTNWTSIATNTLFLGATTNVTDTQASNYVNRFYRAMSVP